MGSREIERDRERIEDSIDGKEHMPSFEERGTNSQRNEEVKQCT
jgi:hypothetical protein